VILKLSSAHDLVTVSGSPRSGQDRLILMHCWHRAYYGRHWRKYVDELLPAYLPLFTFCFSYFWCFIFSPQFSVVALLLLLFLAV